MLVNADNLYVVIRNDNKTPLRLGRRTMLGYAVPLDVEAVYQIDSSNHGLVALPAFHTQTASECKTDIGITVYGDPATREKLVDHIMRYPEV